MQLAQQEAPTELDQIAFAISQAKSREEQAKRERIDLEHQMLALIPAQEEGSTTEQGTFYKVTVNNSFTRKISDPLLLAKELGPELFEKCVRTKYELNLRNYRALPEEEIKKASRFIEAKPKKPSLSIEEIGLSEDVRGV